MSNNTSVLGESFLDFEDEEVRLKPLKTPSEVLNATIGGFPMGKATLMYGSTGTGKSTMCYQTAGIAMQEDENTFTVILDCESSVIPSRLKNVFGMDLGRVRVAHLTTVEDCCEACVNIINNLWKASESKVTREMLENMSDKELISVMESIKKGSSKTHSVTKNIDIQKTKIQMINELLFNGYARATKEKLQRFIVIWDTVASSTIRETEDKVEGGVDMNMRDPLAKARILKNYLSMVIAKMGNLPIALLIINQVSTAGFGTWKGPYESMSGGNALLHLPDVIIHMKPSSKEETDGLGQYTYSKMTLEKNRQGCRMKDIIIKISEVLGGKIVDPQNEFFELAKNLKVIDGSTRYTIMDVTGTYPVTQKMYMKSIQENLDYWYPILKEKCVALLRSKYSSLNEMYIEDGEDDYGNPATVDKKLFDFTPPETSDNIENAEVALEDDPQDEEYTSKDWIEDIQNDINKLEEESHNEE